MDGVMIDSEIYWKKSELSFFSTLVERWTEEDQQKIIGININDTYKLLIAEYGLKITHKEFLRRVNAIAAQVYSEQSNLLNGFSALLNELWDNKIPIGLASSSLNEWIDIVLDRFELRKFFSVVVSAADINGPGKPAPDIYLYTAKKLNTEPKNCLVIEDSSHGTNSAKSAGMFCLGIRNGFNNSQDLSASDMIIDGFTEENNRKILEFFIH